MHTKEQKNLAFSIYVTVVVVALFSVLFIVKEANHDCTGKDCPVCACIRQAKQALKQLGTGDTDKILTLPCLASVITVSFFAALLIPCPSLISQKVRLNN